MSWSISVMGEAQAVLNALPTFKAWPEDTPESQEQIDYAKSIITAEIQAIVNAETTQAVAAQHPLDVVGNVPPPVPQIFVRVEGSGSLEGTFRTFHVHVERLYLLT